MSDMPEGLTYKEKIEWVQAYPKAYPTDATDRAAEWALDLIGDLRIRAALRAELAEARGAIFDLRTGTEAGEIPMLRREVAKLAAHNLLLMGDAKGLKARLVTIDAALDSYKEWGMDARTYRLLDEAIAEREGDGTGPDRNIVLPTAAGVVREAETEFQVRSNHHPMPPLTEATLQAGTLGIGMDAVRETTTGSTGWGNDAEEIDAAPKERDEEAK